MAAVRSAKRNTDLKPHLIYDGLPNALTTRLAEEGVNVIFHRVSFYDSLARYASESGSNKTWLPMASGAYLRIDIPLIETEDNFVLYTDVDVLFCKNLKFELSPPALFAAASQRTFDALTDMNSGVMLINVGGMRADHRSLVDFTCKNLDLGFDQEVLRVFYEGKFSPLDNTLNWKPYWGVNDDAQIVHFHGPKPAIARRLLAKPEYPTFPVWKELFLENVDGYRHYVDMWEENGGVRHVECVIDLATREYISGWAYYPSKPDEVAKMRVLRDGYYVGDAICAGPRPDVKGAGYPTEAVGFHFKFSMDLGKYGCTVQLENEAGSPIQMSIEGQHVAECVIP
jgi:hypothetical protein